MWNIESRSTIVRFGLCLCHPAWCYGLYKTALEKVLLKEVSVHKFTKSI